MWNISLSELKSLYSVHYPKIITFLEYYKAYSMYSMDRYTELQNNEDTKRMSALTSPTMFTLVSTVYSMYLDGHAAFSVYKIIKRFKKWYEDTIDETEVESNLEKNVQKLDEETQTKVNMLLDLLEHIYNQDETEEQLDRIALDAILLWTWFGAVVFYNYKETYNYLVFDEDQQRKVMKDKTIKFTLPWVEYCCPLEIIVVWSWWNKGIRRAKMVIRRRVMRQSNIQKTYVDSIWKFPAIDFDKLNENQCIDKNDREAKIQNMMFNNIPWITTEYYQGITWSNSTDTSSSFFFSDIVGSNSFQIWSDESKKKNNNNDTKSTDPLREVFEIYHWDSMQLFVSENSIGSRPMIWPRNEKPIFTINYKRWLNGVYGMWAWHIAYPLHKVQTAFLNMRIDIARLNANKPMLVKSDETIFQWEDINPQIPWKLIKVHDIEQWIKPAFEDLTGGTISSSEVEATGKMILEAFGLNGYSLWIQNKVERAATNVNALLKSSERGNKEFVKSYGRAMSFISKYWVLLARNLPDELLVKICGTTMIKDMEIDELVNEYNFTFNMKPNQSTVSEARMQVISQLIASAKDMVRADGTALMDQEEAYNQLLEMSDLPESLVLTIEEAKRQNKEKIDTDLELKKYAMDKQQELGIPPDWVPPEEWATPPAEKWLIPVAWVQWWSDIPWQFNNTNPEWIN